MTTHRDDAGGGGTSSRRDAALLAVAVASLLALCACNGDHPVRVRNQEPARQPARVTATSGGEVEPGLSSRGAAPGRVSPLVDPTGSIGRPGSGRMRDGDPTDPLVRATIAQMDRGELEITRLGQSKARDGKVRQYAAAMAQAHQRLLAEAGAPPAGATGDLATFLTDWQALTLRRLTAMPAGPDFDHEFMARQVEAHESAYSTLQQLEQATTNRALEAQIRQRKHDVERHKEQALAVQMAVTRPPAGPPYPGLSSPPNGFYVPSTVTAPESVAVARTTPPPPEPARATPPAARTPSP